MRWLAGTAAGWLSSVIGRGSFGGRDPPRGPREFAIFVFCVSFARSAFQRERANAAQAFVSAALRLDRVAMRDWLRKRLRNRPLAAPIDPASFAISDADIALLMRAAREPPGEAAARPDRDDGG